MPSIVALAAALERVKQLLRPAIRAGAGGSHSYATLESGSLWRTVYHSRGALNALKYDLLVILLITDGSGGLRRTSTTVNIHRGTMKLGDNW